MEFMQKKKKEEQIRVVFLYGILKRDEIYVLIKDTTVCYFLNDTFSSWDYM
jgi:hypothetical protein